MGLEEAGIPTMLLGSAFDILSHAWAPRISFVNYPLGHQAYVKFYSPKPKKDILSNTLLIHIRPTVVNHLM